MAGDASSSDKGEQPDKQTADADLHSRFLDPFLGRDATSTIKPGAGTDNEESAVVTFRRALKVLEQVKEGVPLPSAVSDILEQARKQAEKMTPQQIDERRKALADWLNSAQEVTLPDGKKITVPAWNQEKEGQFTKLHKDMREAQDKLSQNNKLLIAEIGDGLAQVQGDTPDARARRQELNQQLKDLADPAVDKDGTVKAFLDKREALIKFYQDNPDASKRDAFGEANTQLNCIQHAKALTYAIEAMALAGTKQGTDLQRAKDLLAQALKDPTLGELLPESVALANRLGVKVEDDKPVALGPPDRLAATNSLLRAQTNITGLMGPERSPTPLSLIGPGMARLNGDHERQLQEAAGNIAKAYAADRAYAEKQVNDRAGTWTNLGVGIGGDLAAGEAGLLTSRLAQVGINRFAPKLPGPLKFVGIAGAGFLGAYGTKEGIDAGSHALWDTKRHSVGENMFNAGFAFGSFKAASAIGSLKEAQLARALGAEVKLSTSTGEIVTRQGLVDFAAARKMDLATILKPGMSEAQQLSAVRASLGETMATNQALLRSGELGKASDVAFGTGNWTSWINPKNMFMGARGLPEVSSLSQLNARLFYRNFSYNFTMGSVAAGTYSAKNYVPYISENPATGKPYTVADTFSLKTLQSWGTETAVGGLSAGTLAPVASGLWRAGRVVPYGPMQLTERALTASPRLTMATQDVGRMTLAFSGPASTGIDAYARGQYWRSAQQQAEEILRDGKLKK